MNDKEGANKMPNISDVSTATGIAATGFDVASSGIVSRLLDRKYLPEQGVFCKGRFYPFTKYT